MKFCLLLFLAISPCCAQDLPGRFPQASSRTLTADDFKGLYEQDLRVMRNEIFARHGYIFKSLDLKSYFAREKWYKPVSEKLPKVTEIERVNVEVIAAREKELGVENKIFRSAVKSLPFLVLPYNLENTPDVSLKLNDAEFPPYLLRTGYENQPTLVGILPDTSSMYAVVWHRIETLKGNDTLRIPRYYISAFGKFFNHTGTGRLVVWHKKMELKNCSPRTPGRYDSTIKPDWSWNSTFSQFIQCDGVSYGSGIVVNILGKVLPDGSVLVTNDTDPYK